MTHQNDYKLTNELMGKGLEAVPELLRVLLNNAMQVERAKYLQAGIRAHRRPQRACQWVQTKNGEDQDRRDHLCSTPGARRRFLSISA